MEDKVGKGWRQKDRKRKNRLKKIGIRELFKEENLKKGLL